MSQISISQFFAGYMLAGIDPQAFQRLTPEQQLRAQFEFIGGRATYILDLDFDDPQGLPRNIRGEARRILKDLEGALTAIDDGDIIGAAMLSVSIGRWMERVTSGQLAAKAIVFSVDNEALATAQAKYRQIQRTRSAKPREKPVGNRKEPETVGEIIKRLAKKDKTATELWQSFFDELHDAGADPQMERNSTDPRKSKIIYGKHDAKEKPMGKGRFENRISKERKKLSR